MPNSLPGTIFQFGDFRLDCGRFELLRNSRSMRVERKPMELLILLASRQSQLVSRAEIATRLWSNEVFVDTEHGINTAIHKLRHLLLDDPENPRFIQTVTGVGYRFIAPLTVIESSPPETSAEPDAPLAAVGAPGDSASAKPRRQWMLVATSGALIAALLALTVGPHPLAARLFHRSPPPAIDSLAVLPFDNLSGDPNQDYFAQGMTDEITSMLARNSTLRITSRASVMRYGATNTPLPQIARALNVSGILSGSVSRANGRIHLTLQLVSGETGTRLWSDTYDRGAADAADLPSEAARAIAMRLQSTMPHARAALHIDPEAHDAYLQGRYFWFGSNYAKCSALMQKAVDLQPDYALAWSGLADCNLGASAAGILPPGDGLQKEHDAAERALDLDPTLAEAHSSLAAYYFFHSWDWPRAEAEVRRAITLNPNYSDFHHLYSYILFAQNRDQEAFQEQKRATELDPFARPWALGAAYIHLHQYDAAIEELQARSSTASQDSLLHANLAQAFWFKNMKNEWAKQVKRAYLTIGNNAYANAIQRALDTGGPRAVLFLQLKTDREKARSSYVSPLAFAADYAMLGHKENTLRALEAAYRERSPWLTFIQKNPEFDFLHNDPRYRSIVKRVGLPPAY